MSLNYEKERTRRNNEVQYPRSRFFQDTNLMRSHKVTARSKGIIPQKLEALEALCGGKKNSQLAAVLQRRLSGFFR
jgi:hypothetical protein